MGSGNIALAWIIVMTLRLQWGLIFANWILKEIAAAYELKLKAHQIS